MKAVGKGWRALALAALVAGCGGGDGGTSPSVATTVAATSPISQTAVAGLAVADAPTVRVLDQRGDPMAGVSVAFAASGSGTVASPAATTDAAGVASAGTWTLGNVDGAQTVRATVAALAPVTFTATAQARVGTTVVSASAPTQTALSRTPVAEAPAVRVLDQVGDPVVGTAVSFTVTAGGGQLASATGITNTAGLASSGTWTLGAAGQNTVTATAQGVASPVQFNATAQARVPTTITAVVPTTQAWVVGTTMTDPSRTPTVRVKDQVGDPLADVEVSFAVTEGGGNAFWPTRATDQTGAASTGAWTLGPALGRNVLTATVPGLAPVQFEAIGEPSVPTTMEAISPTSQSAPVGAAVSSPPRVRVQDQTGRYLSGVPVTFAVTAGGGTVMVGATTTNGDGIASAGRWTLGPAAGQNTVTATVGSLSPIIFNATAGGDPCTLSVRYTLGTTVSGSLTTTDCRLPSGEYVDFYDTSLPSAQAVSFTMSSTALDSWLELYDGNGSLVGFNDDASSGTNNAALRVFAPAGAYFLAASSLAAGETGAYQISSSALSGNTSCSMPWVVPNVTISGSVTSSDCNSDGYLSDGFLVVLQPGQTLTVRMQSSAMDAYLLLIAANTGSLVDSDDDSGGGLNSLMSYTYTGSTTAVFYIDAGTANRGETGSYTLTVTRS
jgi:hypothetical protein